MHILKMLSRHRRDFRAIYQCEHCKHEYESWGYDDEYFHTKVIPDRECPECGKKASEDYRAFATKYKRWETV